MILEQCQGVHCVDLVESFPTCMYLQNLASIQPVYRRRRERALLSLPALRVQSPQVHVETTGPLLITVELNEASVEAPKKSGSEWDQNFDFYSDCRDLS